MIELDLAKNVAVVEENRPFFSRLDEQGFLPRTVGNQEHAPGPKVGIGVLEKLLIVGSEIILRNQFACCRETKLDDAIAVVLAHLILVKSAVPAGEVEQVARVGCDTGSGLPESTQSSVRSSVPNTLLLEGLRIIGHYPSMIR